MKIRSISVTEASRNFAECVNRVRYQGLSFVLHKGHVPVAKLVPIPVAERLEETTEEASMSVPKTPAAPASAPEEKASVEQVEKLRRRSMQW